MYYVTLKKIESNHNNVRSPVVNGLAPELPVVGQSFFMYSDEVLTPGTSMRYIRTSLIKEVRTSDTGEDIVFCTQNSVYALTSVRRADPINDNQELM